MWFVIVGAAREPPEFAPASFHYKDSNISSPKQTLHCSWINAPSEKMSTSCEARTLTT